MIGTHGRGFYVLDDINVLRQATADITTSALHVFQPNNPLRGLDCNVAIDYYLGKDADEVKVEIRGCRRHRAAHVHRDGEGLRPRPHRRARAEADSAAGRRRASAREGHEPLHLGSAAGGRAGVSRA